MFNNVLVWCWGHQKVKKQQKRAQSRKIVLLRFLGHPVVQYLVVTLLRISLLVKV